MEREDPTWKKSSTDKTLPNRTAPYNVKELPSLENDLNDKLDPHSA
jgi:hypothetical protein